MKAMHKPHFVKKSTDLYKICSFAEFEIHKKRHKNADFKYEICGFQNKMKDPLLLRVTPICLIVCINYSN